MKLTKAQTLALQTIADNPGNVVAILRLSQLGHMLKINGNVETTLSRSGLIEEVPTGRTVTHSGGTCAVNTWELTAAGRAAIKQATAPKTTRKVNVRANLKQSPEIKRTEKSGMDSLRDMLKLY